MINDEIIIQFFFCNYLLMCNFIIGYWIFNIIRAVSRQCHCAIGEFFIHRRNGSISEKIHVDLEPSGFLQWDSEVFWFFTVDNFDGHADSNAHEVIIYTDSENNEEHGVKVNEIRPNVVLKKLYAHK